MMKILQNLKNAVQQALNIPVVSVSVASSDVGKCTTCRFNNGKYDNCTTGTHWAEQGLNRICYEGELWEATER
jgi:hypothetical protein